jgi:carbon monoxide dehydrogenase subunit G
MKIEGTRDIAAPRAQVWAAFLDPATLAKAIPGCEQLEEVGAGEYKAIMKIGVAAIKGTFQGKVRLGDLDPPNRYRMAVEGSGSPGFIRGDAGMELSDIEGGTRVSYSADVQVGGLIASVGQRMLGGVSKLLLDQFFGRMDELLAGGRESA